MNKGFLIICIVAVFLFSPEAIYGQKNIGEFNRKENIIQEGLKKEFDAIGFANSWSSDAKTVEEINQYITKAKSIVSKCEERLQKCKSAINDLPEIPANEIKTNIEYKSWTESLIYEYGTLIRVVRANIESAERKINQAKEKSSANQVAENENSKKASSSGQSSDDFWSDHGSRASDNSTSSSTTSRNSGDSRKVDQYSSERAKANKITADFERREAERVQMESAATHAINTTFTSFYAMRAAGQNLKDATELDGYFENIEDLNRAFAQKLNEVSQMGEELKAVSVQSAQNNANALAAANTTSTADYTAYGQALGAFAGIAAGISADKAAKKAREELRAQRDGHERNIKARQLQALLNIRGEIDQMFPEGGMPLSSHKIDAPVLYLFAYTSNKNEWKEDKTVAMTVSNVIPVYRYSDGTYPYIANVKRTFETGGMSNPVVVGYFTDQAMAEKYQQSLLGVADQGRFLVSGVDIKVIKKDTDKAASAQTDFWGNQIKTEKNDKKKPVTKKKSDDFWNN